MACCASVHAFRPQLRALSPSFLRHRHLVRGNHKSQRRRRLKHHHGGGRDPKPRREAHSESFLDMILLCAPTYVPSRRCPRPCRRVLLCNGSVTCDACAMRVRCVCAHSTPSVRRGGDRGTGVVPYSGDSEASSSDDSSSDGAAGFGAPIPASALAPRCPPNGQHGHHHHHHHHHHHRQHHVAHLGAVGDVSGSDSDDSATMSDLEVRTAAGFQ